jgi:hypothetical protein
MAKNSIRDYDSSSSNNSDVQSVDISEGCSPSGINNAIREVMADLADVNEGTVALESPKFDSIKDGNIKPPDASGTDIAGTATTIKGGAGTGTGAGGSIIFQTADGGSTGSSVNSHATAMTITDDGSLGIGTTSPSWNIHAFQSGALNSVFESDTGNSNVRITSGDGNNAQMFFGDQTNDTISIIRHDNSDNSLQFHTAATERMRINTGGRTDFETSSGQRCIDVYRPTSTGTNHIANFYSDVGGTKTLQQVMEASGDIESRTGNLTGTSDRTLKENIVDATAQWDDIKALDFKNFNFIGEPDRTMLGVIAQDVQAAGMTGLVKTNEETGKLSVKYSVMFMKAVIALQEAMTKIETLETEMTALKARVTALENA